MKNKANVIIGIILIISLISYLIFLYVMYRERKWIFSPYEVPPLKNGFQPNGKIIKLTPDEISQRKKQLSGK